MMETDLNLLFVSITLIILPAIAARNFLLPALVIFGSLVFILPIHYGLTLWVMASTGLCLLGFIITLYVSGKKHILNIDRNVELKKWRIYARPFALLFIPINIFIGNEFLLYLLGILSVIFIGADLYRLFAGKQFYFFYKKKEAKRYSSMTSFLVAIFIVFLLFPAEVAYLCLGFIIFGDMAGKIIGLAYGRNMIIHERTLEGSLGFLTGCIFIGFILCDIFRIDISYLLIGAVFATLTELFSFNMDDNFTVGILTGGCLIALKYFQVI